jgi:hypothetical protein
MTWKHHVQRRNQLRVSSFSKKQLDDIQLHVKSHPEEFKAHFNYLFQKKIQFSIFGFHVNLGTWRLSPADQLPFEKLYDLVQKKNEPVLIIPFIATCDRILGIHENHFPEILPKTEINANHLFTQAILSDHLGEACEAIRRNPHIPHQNWYFQKTGQKMSFLKFAILYESVKIVKLLLNHHADPNQNAPEDPHSHPLMLAYLQYCLHPNKNNTQILELLLKHKANPNIITHHHFGFPILYNALLRKKLFVVALLIKYGANYDNILTNGITLYEFAKEIGYKEALKLMENHRNHELSLNQ